MRYVIYCVYGGININKIIVNFKYYYYYYNFDLIYYL